ncbi:glutamate--cysteine ligase [compost metagenome]
MVKDGRRPGLHLQQGKQSVLLKDWANELLERIAPISELLDRANGSDQHRQSLDSQREKVANPDLTPSAQVLAEMRTRGESFSAFALRQSREHAEQFFATPLSAEKTVHFETLAANSLAEQAALERHPEGDFDTFVAAYQASILGLIGV